MIEFLEKKARLTMLLRSQAILSSSILSAIEAIPREKFIDRVLRNHAYENASLPIACGQTISQPYIVAKMTEALELNSRHVVLEIGTGSGYQASILSLLTRRVYTMERHRPLFIEARKRLAELKLTNIVMRLGDGFIGWPEAAPFDRIIVTAASDDPPASLLSQLKIGGIMVIPVGQSDNMQKLIKITKTDGGYEYQDLHAVRFVPLVAGTEKEQ